MPVVEDPHTPVFDQVRFPCDFPAWLKTRSPLKRRKAERPAMGYGTTAVAKRFGLSTGRISQFRGELRESWAQFQGEKPKPAGKRHETNLRETAASNGSLPLGLRRGGLQSERLLDRTNL